MRPRLGTRDTCLLVAGRKCIPDVKTCCVAARDAALVLSMTCSAVSCPAVNMW